MESGAKLRTLTKLLYGSGDFGYSMNNSIIAALFPIFMMDVVGVTPALAAAALFIGRSWDYINDPLVGYLSDRTRTRWGRRRPWLLFGALPFALTFTLLWIKPTFITTQTGMLIFFAVVYLIYEASATTVYMPYFALTPELTQDYDERTQLTSFRMLFNIIGGLTAYTLPMLVIGSMIPENANRVVLMAIIFGFLAAAPYLVVFFSVREKKEYLDQAQPKLRDAFKAVRRNKPFFFAAMIYLCTWIVIILAETNLMFYIKYVLKRPNQSSLVMGAIFISAIIFIVDRVGALDDTTGAAVVVVDLFALAFLVLLEDRFTADLGSAFKTPAGEVAGRQASSLVEDVDQDGSAIGIQAAFGLGDCVRAQGVDHLLAAFFEEGFVDNLNTRRTSAVEDDEFEAFGGHHCA